MFRFKQFLLILENRIDFLKGQQSPELHDVIDHYATHVDPTEGKEYTSKLLSWHKAGLIKPEDAPNLRETLTDFHKLKNITGRLPKRDISAYKTPSEVEDAVVGYAGESGKEKDERVKKEEIKHIYSENGVSIISPTTRDAAELCSKDAQWCTGAKKENMFDYYNNKGPLYIMHIPQKDKPQIDENGELKKDEVTGKPLPSIKQPPTKYQYHPATGEFKDEQDRNADLDAVATKTPEIVRGLRKIGLGKDLVANRQELEAKLNDGGAYPGDKAKLIKNHPLVTPEDITKVLNNSDSSIVKEAAVQHPTAFTKEHMDELMNNHTKYGDHIFNSALENSPQLKEEHVDKLVNEFSAWKKYEAGNGEQPSSPRQYSDTNVEYALFNPHGAVKSHHITAILNSIPSGNFNYTKKAAIENPAATPEHLSRILDNPNETEDIRAEALRSKSLTPKQVTKVMLGNPDLPTNRQEFHEKTLAIMHPTAVRSGHIDMMLNDPDFNHWDGKEDVIEQSNAVTPKHIDKIINNPQSNHYLVKAALQNKAATPENVDSLMNNYLSGETHSNALVELFENQSRLIRPHHIDALLDDPTSATGNNYHLISNALLHPTAVEPRHIDKILANTFLRDSFLHRVIKSPAFTSEHIGKILRDPEIVKNRGNTIQRVLEHPKLLPSHVDRVLNDDNFNYENSKDVIQHPTAVRPRHIDAILDNPDKYDYFRDHSSGVVKTALKHPAVRPRHIDKMLANPDKYTASELATGLTHPTAVTPEHINMVSQNPSLKGLQSMAQTMNLHRNRTSYTNPDEDQ